MKDIEVIYSDKDFIVINKPPGISVHGGDTVSGPTVVDFLLGKFPEIQSVGEDPMRPGIVHRLDKDTSGVMVVARNQKSFEELKEIFQNREVEKTYWAVVCGKPKQLQGTIDMPIGRIVKNPLKRGVEIGSRKIRGAREAVTEWKILKSNGQFSLFEVKPKTGRMHQIRVHLAAIHHPIACDTIYGGKDVCCLPAQASPKRQLLHARKLVFALKGKQYEFEAEAPEDFELALNSFDI